MTIRSLGAICMLVVTVATGPLAGCSSAAKAAPVAVLDDAVQSLASGGIAVMDDVRSTLPSVALSGSPSAMRFTRWQVQNLVAEADSHSGYLRSELDGLASPPAGAPPLSTLINAWLIRKDGALARYAASLMWQQDQKAGAPVVYPTLVVLAFIGDIARVNPTSQLPRPSFDPERLFAAPAEADGVCTDLSGWVSSVVNNVATAIQSNGSGWLATLWNTVVSVGGAVITAAFNTIAQSVLGFITQIATICGVIMQVSSMFKPWSVQLAGAPPSIQLSDATKDGQFTATLQAADIPWPSSLVSCVMALSNIKLDDASYADAPITWTPQANIPGLATETTADATLLANKTAAYHFQTTTVPDVPAGDCPRTVPAGALVMLVSVARSDIAKTLASLESLITNQINAAIRPYLTPYIKPALAAANTAAGKFAAPHQTASISLNELVADPLCPNTPPPNVAAPQPSVAGGSGALPNLPCTALATSGDTAPYLDGGVVFTPVDENGKEIDFAKEMGSLMSGTALDAPNGQSFLNMPDMPTASDYDQKASTWCTIGKLPATIDAIFGELPKGASPYHPLPNTAPSDITGLRACRAVIGIDLLNYFQADCRQLGHTVTVYGSTAEYIVTVVDPVTPDQASAVLKHILQRAKGA
jgi:hypothetical protein